MPNTGGWIVVRAFLALAVVLVIFALAGCTTVTEGPPVELADIAVPKVVSDAALAPRPVVAPPPPAVPVPRGGFRAWIPPVVTPNGDVHEGHYVEVSNKAPQKELTRPAYDIPRAPRQIFRPQPKKDTPSGQGASSVAPAYVPPPVPQPQGTVPPGVPLSQEGTYGLP